MPDFQYPLNHLADLVDHDQVASYLQMLFGGVEWGEQSIGIRVVPEQGTSTRLHDQIWVVPTDDPLYSPGYITYDNELVRHVTRWAVYHGAAYIMPALLTPRSKPEAHMEEQHVEAFTTLVVDLDSGDIGAKLDHLRAALWPYVPTMVVRSGGVTPDGQQKLHVYWALSEPTTDLVRVAGLRNQLAVKAGGDISFKRIAQVIRIPGSVHSKNGISRTVTIVEYDPTRRYELDDLAEKIEAMATMPGVVVQPDPVMGGESKFRSAMSTFVHAGGVDGATRWDSFSSVAGGNILLARVGKISRDVALHATIGWAYKNMEGAGGPDWPPERMEREFRRLEEIDAQKPEQPAHLTAAAAPPLIVMPGIDINSAEDLSAWAVSKRSNHAPAPRRWLVPGLVLSGKRHTVVAEGGAGKTYLMMDLALKLAIGSGDWLGHAIDPAEANGKVILLTAEDDLDELDLRWHELDPSFELRKKAGDRLIALPLDSLGGAFPFVTYGANKEPVASDKWARLFKAMQETHDAGERISAVIVDTLSSTLHGEENSSNVISEYIRVVSPVCGYLGAAFIVTHHTKKPDSKFPIRDLDDMREAVRGSTALINGPRLNLGFWHASDYRKRMAAMGLKPERHMLYFMGVVKGNTGEYFKGVKTLLRSPGGLLQDVTASDVMKAGPRREHDLWLLLAVKQAAAMRCPFTKTKENRPYKRQHQLPAMLKDLTDAELTGMIERLLDVGALVAARLYGQKGGHAGYLDVPAGPVAAGSGANDATTWQPDWSGWDYDRDAGVLVGPDGQVMGL